MHMQELVQGQHPTLSDTVLIQQAQSGDERAFEILFHRYYAELSSLIYQILKDDDRVQDVLQHVFLQLYLSLATIKVEKSIHAWLRQVAYNRCVDELRRSRTICFSELKATIEKRGETLPWENIPDTAPLPEEAAELHDIEQRIQWAILVLPPRMRPVVMLRYTSQMPYSEIGRMLSIPEATARTYFKRAKPLLRASFVQGREEHRKLEHPTKRAGWPRLVTRRAR